VTVLADWVLCRIQEDRNGRDDLVSQAACHFSRAASDRVFLRLTGLCLCVNHGKSWARWNGRWALQQIGSVTEPAAKLDATGRSRRVSMHKGAITSLGAGHLRGSIAEAVAR